MYAIRMGGGSLPLKKVEFFSDKVRTTIEIFEILVSGRSAKPFFFFKISKVSISEHFGSIGICIKKGEGGGSIFFDALP